jgi:hypothetical protein
VELIFLLCTHQFFGWGIESVSQLDFHPVLIAWLVDLLLVLVGFMTWAVIKLTSGLLIGKVTVIRSQ